MNEFNDFNDNENYEDEYENNDNFDESGDFSFGGSTDDKAYQMKTWIIVGVISLLTFIIVFVISNMLVNGGKKKAVDNIQKPVEEVVTYDEYKLGDTVKLKDGSTWHVLYESLKTTEYVTLLSDVDVNDSDVLYGNVNSFLRGTFKNKLTSALSAESSDIQEVRLLAYIDLSEITKSDSSEFEPEVEVKKFDIPKFIYGTETVTDTVYQTEDGNSPIMLCSADEVKDYRFCLGDSTKTLPVRPVLVISKKYVEAISDITDNDKVEDEDNGSLKVDDSTVGIDSKDVVEVN